MSKHTSRTEIPHMRRGAPQIFGGGLCREGAAVGHRSGEINIKLGGGSWVAFVALV